jgi:hypothetical protein
VYWFPDIEEKGGSPPSLAPQSAANAPKYGTQMNRCAKNSLCRVGGETYKAQPREPTQPAHMQATPR